MTRQKPQAFDLPNPAFPASFAEDEPGGALDPAPPRPGADSTEAAGEGAVAMRWRDLPSLSPSDEDPAAFRSRSARAPSPLPYYLTALAVSILVVLAPVMFAWSYQRDITPFRNDVFSLTMVAGMALGPAALVWLAAFVLHQTARMSAEARRTRVLTDQLAQPAALAAHGAGSAVQDMRQEIEHAASVAARARNEILSLREVLAAESERLIEAAEGSGRAAGHLARELAAERERMTALATSLDSQAGSVTEAIGRHARMVAEASDLAETQLREAEASLAARAADLAAAAGEASDAARIASEDLSRQVARLETASQGVGDQVRLVEDGLTEQRAALVTVAHGLRADHEVFAAEAETELARLNEVLIHAREGASELAETAARGAEGLGRMIAGAGEQFSHIVQATAQERDLLSASAAQSLGAISEIAARERQTMELQAQMAVDNMVSAADRARRDIEAQARAIAEERDLLGAASSQSITAVSEIAARERAQLEAQSRQTIEAVLAAAETARQAMEAHAETARHKVDQLSEASFVAGQRAETVFENRLSEARGLIEQSARLVDEAGAAAAARLGEGVQSARSTLAELEALMGAVDTRISQLPTEAKARAETVRETIERGMDDLMASARRAAEETQAIDAAFQDRVRRNYDMLSEAVRLMGVVAGAAGGGAPRPVAASPARPPLTPLSEELRRTEAARTTEARPAEPRPMETSPAPEAGLRPRLRLTPTATDEEFKQVFDAAGGREAPPRRETSKAEPVPGSGGDGWTWRELLSSMDEEPQVDETNLAERVLGEIEAMGIDAGALLPRARIEEWTPVLREGRMEVVRAAVIRLAPAALRRLSRRLMADRIFRAQADRFVDRHRMLIHDAAARDDDGVVMQALLGSDHGRAYLLFDAALNETL
ncbi:MAG: polar localization protein TipN [Caulobacteraceae bacterium]|nr:polar localization protein TipN [Caulobacteraceae bacterium]